MSDKFKTFRARTDEAVAERLNALEDAGTEFSVISINQVQGWWVVFYSVEEVADEEPVGFDWENVPDDRDWIEMVRVSDPRAWTDNQQEIDEYNSRGFFKRIFGRT